MNKDFRKLYQRIIIYHRRACWHLARMGLIIVLRRVNFFWRFSRRFSSARIPPSKLFCPDITPVLTPTSRCISAGRGVGRGALAILSDNIRLRLIARAAQAGFKLRGDEGEKITGSKAIYWSSLIVCTRWLTLIMCRRSILFNFIPVAYVPTYVLSYDLK